MTNYCSCCSTCYTTTDMRCIWCGSFISPNVYLREQEQAEKEEWFDLDFFCGKKNDIPPMGNWNINNRFPITGFKNKRVFRYQRR